MQSVLDTLLRDSVATKIQPNADTLNIVMGGWLKSNKPEAQERIEDILEKMQINFANGNEDAKPDRRSGASGRRLLHQISTRMLFAIVSGSMLYSFSMES